MRHVKGSVHRVQVLGNKLPRQGKWKAVCIKVGPVHPTDYARGYYQVRVLVNPVVP